MKVTKPLKGHENANARVEYTYQKNDGRGLICLMGICVILAVVIAIIAFIG